MNNIDQRRPMPLIAFDIYFVLFYVAAFGYFCFGITSSLITGNLLYLVPVLIISPMLRLNCMIKNRLKAHYKKPLIA